MTTTVREARPEEAADVAALVRDGYLAYAGAVPPDLLCTWIDDVADAGGGVTFVAFVDGTFAGTARLHLGDTYPVPLPGGSAGVRAVVVALSHRRAGVGSVLMAACAERAWTCGVTALYLHTAPFMAAAAALYDGLGYRRDPAVDLDVGAHFGAGPAGEVVVAAYRLDLAPASRVLDDVPERRSA